MGADVNLETVGADGADGSSKKKAGTKKRANATRESPRNNEVVTAAPAAT
jgi:hypothetical protein